ncbi:YbaB/EbfC family nucleoid-associated protein [Microbacterium sp. P01]|uniref:YbaB/EbfC family nucleoid-associated protein n=1 Tax=unclassified Microbacterium TaxID=2609290 RepID=UPI003672D90B
MSDFFSADIDADLAIERVQQQIADAQARAAKAQAMRSDIEAVRGVASSPRREVTITVDASGRLAGVELADSAYDLSARELGRLIVETSNDAQRKAGEQALALAAEAFGEDSSVVDHLRAELDKEPPSAEPELRH